MKDNLQLASGTMIVLLSSVMKKIFEIFIGKQPTEEEKKEIERRKAHKRKVMQIQRESEEAKEIELAKQGLYKQENIQKPKQKGIFDNIGKHNPIGDFNFNNNINKAIESDLNQLGYRGKRNE